MDAIAPGFGTKINNGQANARGLAGKNHIALGQTNSHGIDKAVAIVTRMETDRTANGWHTKTVAVAANAGHHASDKCFRSRMAWLAKAQKIERGNGPCTHRENIAQNTTNARRRPLVGFDIRGVIVALHLENHHIAITDINHASILAGPINHTFPRGGQGF